MAENIKEPYSCFIEKYKNYQITVIEEGEVSVIFFEGPQNISSITFFGDFIPATIRAKEMINMVEWRFYTKVKGYGISVRYVIKNRGWEFQAKKEGAETLTGSDYDFIDTAIAAGTAAVNRAE